MAGNKNDLGARLPDLVGLYFAAFEAVFFYLATYGHGAPTSTATIIIVTLVFHRPEILRKKFSKALVFYCQPATSNNIAWVLDSGGFFYFIL